ncbi:hypothetical protein [Pollutibacter soli]|uniref:hypothetical protein n=1 Tax=Pollutibacter soli TaxID=3034157 RepID=UPI00301323D4
MRLIVCAFLLTALVSGCSKEKRNLKKADASLKGVWELRLVSGTMLPPQPYAAGNENRLEFDGSRFKKYENGTPVKSGTYNIVHEPNAQDVICMMVDPGTFDEKIVFNPESDLRPMLIEIDGDKLAVLTGCFAIDGGARYDYVRK